VSASRRDEAPGPQRVLEHRRFAPWIGSWLAAVVVAVALGVLTWRGLPPLLAPGAVVASWFGELVAVTLVNRWVKRDRPA
jgi:hypothetical protein